MSNSKCNLCGSNVPLGYPCLNCLEKKRIKEGDFVLTAEELLKRVSILRLQENDILVVRTRDYHEDLYDSLSIVAENLKFTQKIMYCPDDTDFLIIRSGKGMDDGKES